MDGVRVTDTVTIPAAELSWRFSRASGPGGQGVNTTDSRVELTVDLSSTSALTEEQRARVLDRLAGRLVQGRLTVVAAEHRSQLRNRDAAVHRAATLVREALAPGPAPRRATRPSRGAQRRRMEAKSRRGDLKRLRRPPPD